MCFIGLNGQQLVAIAGGYANGIEVWNPADGSVKTLNPDFPLAGVSPMIAVNGNTELIYYEYGLYGSPKGVWKFSQLTNAWTKIGELLFGRGLSSAQPVQGLSCL